MMDQIFYISGQGLARCPRCGRHVLLDDEVAETRCPFCSAGMLDAPIRHAGPTDAIESIGGIPGTIARALRRIGGPPPAPAPPRDPGMDGDPEGLWRMGALDGETPRLRHAVWELTLACDLGCKHCGSRAGHARTDELSTAECFDVVDQLRDLGVREITLIGGEAYLRDDWTRIAARIVDAGMLCTMTTGARNLTDDRVHAAADAGIGSIGISIDGLEATHDALRGARGSWRAAVAAAARVGRSPVRLATNTQLNALSAPEIPALARLLADIGSTAWQLQLTVPMGRAAERPGLLLQPFELLELYPLLIWTKEQILDPHGIALVPGNNIGYFSPFEQHLRYGGDHGAHWTACAAGRHVIGIEADGSIKGCPSLPSDVYIGGNIRDTPIRTIVEQRPELTHLGRRTGVDLWGFCHDCYYSDVCQGGCTWTTHCVVGRPGNNPYCSHRAVELAGAGLAERVVQVESAAGVPFDSGRFEVMEEALDAGRCARFLFGVPIEQIVAAQPDAGSVRPPSAIAEMLSPDAAPGGIPVRLHVRSGRR